MLYGDTRISLAGVALELTLLGLASLGWHQDDLTGTGISKTPARTGLAKNGLTGTALRWRQWDSGVRTASG